jgi:RNA polymerase sigma-70 factor (ECF subfamily)
MQIQLEDLYRSHGQRFARLAWAITGDRELAWDALQDGFANALVRSGSFRGEGSLEAWVARIVANAAQDALRRQRLDGRLAAAVDVGEPEVADDDTILRAAVAALPERQRLAVFLRHYADFDYAQIAHALEIERGTVSAMLSAAHSKLARTLREEATR